jgi:hypothetical protein
MEAGLARLARQPGVTGDSPPQEIRPPSQTGGDIRVGIKRWNWIAETETESGNWNGDKTLKWG